MSAEEAANALGVSLATLYTYVSRKNIRAHRQNGTRSSRYLRADIERLRTGSASDPSGDHSRSLVSSTAITLLTEGGSYYRGTSAIELARTASLEDVARILWDTNDYDPFGEAEPGLSEDWHALAEATSSYNLLDQFAMLLPALEAANARAHDLEKASFLRSGVHILRAAAAVFLGEKTISSQPLHRTIAIATKCGP